MFADDILLLAEDWEQAAAAIRIVESWAKDANMEINRGKSGIMTFDAPAPSTTQANGYPHVSRYKYLGCWVTPTL